MDALNVATNAATLTAMLGGAAKSYLFERPRILLALPHARAAGKVPSWAAMLVTGQPMNSVVPMVGGTLRVGSKRIEDTWHKAYVASTVSGAALLAVASTYFVPNLVSGHRKHPGVEGLTQSREGRIGLLAGGGTAAQLSVYGAAAWDVRNHDRVLADTFAHRWIQTRSVTIGSMAVGAAVMLNYVGYGDFLDAGDPRGARTTAVDTTRSLWRRLPAPIPGAA